MCLAVHWNKSPPSPTSSNCNPRADPKPSESNSNDWRDPTPLARQATVPLTSVLTWRQRSPQIPASSGAKPSGARILTESLEQDHTLESSFPVHPCRGTTESLTSGHTPPPNIRTSGPISLGFFTHLPLTTSCPWPSTFLPHTPACCFLERFYYVFPELCERDRAGLSFVF